MIAQESELRALMLAALKGDGPAYRTLLATLTSSLRTYYVRRIERADAEDLVQETLLAIHAKRATYDPAQPFTAWVHAIARYKLIDHLRRAKLRKAVPLDEAGALFAADETGAAIERRDLARLMEALPEKSRELVRLLKIEGRSGAEAAAETGMSEGAVKVALHRTLKALAARVGGSRDP